MKNIKTFENYSKEDDEMLALIKRATKFEQEMKSRKKGPTKIKLGDSVCIGKINRARGSRTYDLFDGLYYKCIGTKPVLLEEEKTNKRITLSEKDVESAEKKIASLPGDENSYYWMIERK